MKKDSNQALAWRTALDRCANILDLPMGTGALLSDTVPRAVVKIVALKNDLMAAIEGLLRMEDERYKEEHKEPRACECVDKAPENLTEPGPCEYCIAREAVSKAKG